MSKHATTEEILAGWDSYDRPADGDRFRHYKGGEYEIVATGFFEATESPCVVYRSILKNVVWVRTAQNFLEDIEFEGKAVARFTKFSKP